MTPITLSAAADLLHTEALCLDDKRWQDWLALYQDDAVYWVPSWRAEHTLVDNPDTEISFIYLDSKRQLEERVRRIKMGKTVTALPLPRTLHCIGNVQLADESEAGRWQVRAAWTTHLYDPRTQRQSVLFGRCEHTLQLHDGAWRIARKKVVLMNDRVPTVLDIYSV